MSAPIRVETEAARELEEAVLWYDEQRAGLGLEFLESVERALDRIARWPDAGAPVPGVGGELRVRRVPLGRFPFHLIYLRGPEDTKDPGSST